MAQEILVVDDEADIRSLIGGILEDEGYVARQAQDGPSALQAIDQRRPHLIILDVWLGDSRFDGLKILEMVQKSHPDIPVLMISGHGTIETAVTAIRKGAYDFIEKPFKAEKLLILVRRALETLRLKRDMLQLQGQSAHTPEVIGHSTASNQLRQSIQKLATVESRVLICGPKGVGKELAARLIHLQSRRHQGPFEVFHCGHADPESFERDLFGVENYDDTRPRMGALERVHGGTLFLDEIAEIPLTTQTKLLKFFQEKKFTRLGGHRAVDVDVRVLSASSKPMETEVSHGRVRQDLLFHLSVVGLAIAPLKQRPDDIPIMFHYFMNKRAKALGLQTKTVRDDALTALMKYNWPGNVRQLINVVDWIFAKYPDADSKELTLAMLPHEIAQEIPAVLGIENANDILQLPLREAREIFEREYVASQLAKYSGNVSQTAHFIGMERSALHRKLKALSIQFSDKADGS